MGMERTESAQRKEGKTKLIPAIYDFGQGMFGNSDGRESAPSRAFLAKPAKIVAKPAKCGIGILSDKRLFALLTEIQNDELARGASFPHNFNIRYSLLFLVRYSSLFDI